MLTRLLKKLKTWKGRPENNLESSLANLRVDDKSTGSVGSKIWYLMIIFMVAAGSIASFFHIDYAAIYGERLAEQDLQAYKSKIKEEDFTKSMCPRRYIEVYKSGKYLVSGKLIAKKTNQKKGHPRQSP